jgi:hypothetical protein
MQTTYDVIEPGNKIEIRREADDIIREPIVIQGEIIQKGFLYPEDGQPQGVTKTAGVKIRVISVTGPSPKQVGEECVYSMESINLFAKVL